MAPHHIHLATACVARSRRADAVAFWGVLGSQRYVVLDLEGVDDATVTFLRHLVFELPHLATVSAIAINASPRLRRRLERARLMFERRLDLLSDRCA